MLLIALSLFDGDYWLAWLAAAGVFGLVNYTLWRRGGLGHDLRRHMLRRFPKRERP